MSRSVAYRYHFTSDETAPLRDCYQRHGFLVVERLLSPARVERLKQSAWTTVVPDGELAPGSTRVCLNFIERSPALAELLECPDFLRVVRAILGDEFTLNRTAAIAKNVGAPAGAWHSDWAWPESQLSRESRLLNQYDCPSFWFYLNGTHPSRAGLAVIPDSDGMNWPGLEGFHFLNGRASFARDGESEPCTEMDHPQMLSLLSEPGDLVIFGPRTYHGVNPHRGAEVRLSCGLAFRPGREPIPDVWPLSEFAKRFRESCSPAASPYVEFYAGMPEP